MFSSICRLVSSSEESPPNSSVKTCEDEISTEPLIRLKKNPATAAAQIRENFIVFMSITNFIGLAMRSVAFRRGD